MLKYRGKTAGVLRYRIEAFVQKSVFMIGQFVDRRKFIKQRCQHGGGLLRRNRGRINAAGANRHHPFDAGLCQRTVDRSLGPLTKRFAPNDFLAEHGQIAAIPKEQRLRKRFLADDPLFAQEGEGAVFIFKTRIER
ncbi:MAG: hypothetical protein ALAOOOJD_00819 [bacterium]|nr:hypothetical protein [bacterium]